MNMLLCFKVKHLEFPYHQIIHERLHALYTARYDAVLERLLYPGEEPPFTTALDNAHAEALFYRIDDNGASRVPSEHSILETDLGKLLGMPSPKKSAKLAPAKAVPDLPTAAEDLETLAFFDKKSREEPDSAALQLHTLMAYGLIGARHKPPTDDIKNVLRPKPSLESPPEHKVFRKAVRLITRHLVSVDEEKVLERNIPKFKEQLDRGLQLDKNVANFNRYHLSRLARRIHELLLRPATIRRDTIDEVNFQQGLVEPLPPLPLQPGQAPLVIRLPWPLLPPGEGPERGPLERARRVPTGLWRRRLDSLRLDWLELLVRKWPHSGIVLEIDLEPSVRVKDNGYQAAILLEPNEKDPFAIVADSTIAFPENRLLVGIVKQLINPETGQPAEWTEVFSRSKSVAYKAGAIGINHGGRDFHGRVIKYLEEAYKKQYENVELAWL